MDSKTNTFESKEQLEKTFWGGKMSPTPGRVVILVGDTSAVLFYSSNNQNSVKGVRVAERTRNQIKTIQRRGDNSKIKKARMSFLYAVHFVLFCSTFLPGKIKIIQRVSELQSGHEIKFNHKKGR